MIKFAEMVFHPTKVVSPRSTFCMITNIYGRSKAWLLVEDCHVIEDDNVVVARLEECQNFGAGLIFLFFSPSGRPSTRFVRNAPLSCWGSKAKASSYFKTILSAA